MEDSELTVEIKGCLATIPEDKRIQKVAMITASHELSELKHAMNIIESRTYMLTLKNPDLKNETAKKEAVFLNLNTNKEYMKLREEFHKQETIKGMADADLTKLRAKMGLYRLLLQSMELDKE